MKDEALRLALEALKQSKTTTSIKIVYGLCDKAIAAIKQALAAHPAVQEPDLIARLKHPEQHYEFTDPKKANAVLMSLCQEAADALAAPVQEPVAWMYPDDYKRMLTSETFCTVYSVEVGSATRGKSTVPLYTTPPAAQRQWVGLETLIPEGWRFYTADFSMQATGKRNCGSVMLIRDEKGVAEWHKLPDDLKESDDGPPLYLSGTGKTLQEAIKEASARAIEFSLKEKNNGN